MNFETQGKVSLPSTATCWRDVSHLKHGQQFLGGAAHDPEAGSKVSQVYTSAKLTGWSKDVRVCACVCVCVCVCVSECVCVGGWGFIITVLTIMQ